MHIDPSLLTVYALLGIIVILIVIIVWTWNVHRKMHRVLIGKDAKSLEDSIHTIVSEMKNLTQFTKDMEQYLTTVEMRLKKSIQAVETVRFNPFKGTGSGGNNSFSTSFITEKGDGVVLTSMYSRDRISMFAKPIKNFKSEYELSEEEMESVEKTKKSLGT